LALGTLAGAGRRALLATEARASLAVLGPTQSGKTTALAVPAILEWQGPVVATSVKADLVADTLGWRGRLGPVWLYDPTSTTGLAARGWSPLARCDDWAGARRTAAWLCSGVRRGRSGLNDEEFWYTAAAKLLAPLLLAAAVDGRDMGCVLRWLDMQEEAEVAGVLERFGLSDALGAATASWGRDERTRSSVYATAEVVLEAFADPAVRVSAARSEISPEALLAGAGGTLYVCAPAHEQERLRPVFVTLLQEVINAALERSLRCGRPLEPSLLVVLDEAANIAPLRDLDGLASTAAGHGIQLVTVWHDMAQIRSRYGERAATVLNNHRAKVVLSGISDPATLEYASALVGEVDVPEASETIGGQGERSTTRSARPRPLAPAASLRQMRPGEGVLVYGHLPPVRLRLRPWFADRELRRRQAGGVKPVR